MLNNHGGRNHALCSASSAERWLNCRGSIGMCLEAPPQPQSPYAAEGQRAHEVAEAAAKHLIATRALPHDDWWTELGRLHPDATERDERGDTMLDHVRSYVALLAEELLRFDASPALSAHTEVRLVLDEERSLFGTADFIATGHIRGEPVGLVVDFKYGKGLAVRADMNPQLLFYACALRRNSKKELKRVRTAVVQPRLDAWWSAYTYDRQQLVGWEAVFKHEAHQAMLQAMTKEYELTPGAHCRFCPAKGGCSAHAKHLAEQTALDFGATPAPPPDPATLPPERIAKILAADGAVRQWLDAVEQHATGLLLNDPEAIPGWKLVEGRTRRRWTQGVTEQELAARLAALGVAPYTQALVSPAQAEKQVGKDKRHQIAELVDKPPGAPSLASATDPRPPYVRADLAALAFADETGDP